MDTQDLIEKLKAILARSEEEATSLVNNSNLPIDERFEASRHLECTLLRVQLTQFVSDLEALD